MRPLVEPLIGNEQESFRPGRQTKGNIFTVRNILEKAWDRGGSKYLAFLDNKTAFHSVPKMEIREALNAKCVPQNLIDAINSTYQDPKGIVGLNG